MNCVIKYDQKGQILWHDHPEIGLYIPATDPFMLRHTNTTNLFALLKWTQWPDLSIAGNYDQLLQRLPRDIAIALMELPQRIRQLSPLEIELPDHFLKRYAIYHGGRILVSDWIKQFYRW